MSISRLGTTPAMIAAILLAAMATGAGPVLAATSSVVNVELNEEGTGQVIKLDKTSVPAGKVTFDVSNASVMHEHELIVVKTPLKPEQFATNKDRSRVDEKKFKGAKELSDLKPDSKGKLVMDLKPGHYVLFCNIKNHFKDGMYAELNVTG